MFISIVQSILKYILFALLVVTSLAFIGVSFFTIYKTETVINILEHLNPTPTPSPMNIKGVAVIGDSQSDEYQGNDKRGQTYASTTYNWVEILAKKRQLDFGAWGERDEPRRMGYEYNWARTGATTLSMITSGQHIGVAEQVRQGKVNLVILYIGANDFAPMITTEDYVALYEGRMSEAETYRKINLITAHIKTAIETIKQAGDAKMLIITIPDWSRNIGIQIAFPLPDQRNRVSEVISQTNEEIEKVAQRYKVPTLDPNEFYRSLLDKNKGSKLTVGDETIYQLPPSNEPRHIVLDDGIHTGTVFNGLFANYVISALNSKLGTTLKPLSSQEILETAGL